VPGKYGPDCADSRIRPCSAHDDDAGINGSTTTTLPFDAVELSI
jgi:hypothetical protein